jgi:hypothetical protein
MRYEFGKPLLREENPFFQARKTVSSERFTVQILIDKMVALRKQNHSIQDIRMLLKSSGAGRIIGNDR